jgi:hypothetical protein
MSETKKNRDAATQEAHAATEALGQGGPAAQNLKEEQGRGGEAVGETVARTADAAVEMGQRVADQGREVMLLGARTAADMNGRIADEGLECSHRLLGATARALDIFRQAGDSTTGHMQAWLAASMSVGLGARQMQHAYFDMLDRAIAQTIDKPQALLHWRTWPACSVIFTWGW